MTDNDAVLGDAPSDLWEPDTDSLDEMNSLITAVAREWNGGSAAIDQGAQRQTHLSGPCRCCGIILTDLPYLEDSPSPIPAKAVAIEMAKSFIEAAIWNAQVVRRAIPARTELLSARSSVVRIHRLLAGDHEEVGKAHGWDRPLPQKMTDEEWDVWTLQSWCPPAAFIREFSDLDQPAESLTAAATRFVEATEMMLNKIDEFIFSRMFEPPSSEGRPRTAFAERYAYRYLGAIGVSPTEIERSIGALILKLRAAEHAIGLKRFSKSSHPASLRSTIKKANVKR